MPITPILRDDGPNAASFGQANGYPVGSRKEYRQQGFLVGQLSAMDRVFPGSPVTRGETISPWTYSEGDVARIEADLGLAQYFDKNPVTGLLIARNDEILYERYQYARSPEHRFASFSMAKTITAMLIGIAVSEGAIASIEDLAGKYVPELAGTKYGAARLKHLLQMSSGVLFREVYGTADIEKLGGSTLGRRTAGGPAVVTEFNTQQWEPGTHFQYSSAETQVLGLVLRSATGRAIVDYLSEKIWRPMGAEADACWLTDASEQEITFCCFNAVLRDYARFGRLLANDGVMAGRQIIPADWIFRSTSLSDESSHLKPGQLEHHRFGYGYGFQTWIWPTPERRFMLRGIRGQMTFVDPNSKVVIAHTGAWPQENGPVDIEIRSLLQKAVAILS